MMSFAVAPHRRSQGLGSRLVNSMLVHLHGVGVRRAYLLSRGAGAFWMRHGFVRIPVSRVIAEASDHYQVATFVADGSIESDVPYERALTGNGQSATGNSVTGGD
jgi:N-acetylglutamate synthase-like GNAT family acetyltransferase